MAYQYGQLKAQIQSDFDKKMSIYGINTEAELFI